MRQRRPGWLARRGAVADRARHWRYLPNRVSKLSLAKWTHILAGLEPERVRAARAEISSWSPSNPARHLLVETVDAAVASTLLVEGIDKLVAHGVPREQLMRKVRLDREIWGTWAEIRAADLVLRAMRDDVELRLEEGRSSGAHADLRFITPQAEDATSIEVKAIGLSDDEVAFCRRMARTLQSIVPDEGHVLLHAPIESDAPLFSSSRRRAVARLARDAARETPSFHAASAAYRSSDMDPRRAMRAA